MFTFSVHAPSHRVTTVGDDMAQNPPQRATRLHRHTAVLSHALRQQAGIPYEVEQKVCLDCRRVLGERTLRRAAA
jgi:hypothetical protein